MNIEELTLLTEGQVWGNRHERQLDVLKKYGTKSAITDLVILTGGYWDDMCTFRAPDDNGLTGRTGWVYTQSSDDYGTVLNVNKAGSVTYNFHAERRGAIRPIILLASIFNISANRVRGYNATEEIEYGEYPQSAVNFRMQKKLESAFNRKKLQCTGKSYTFDSTPFDEQTTGFNPVVYEEYGYNDSKYIRVKANSNYKHALFKLSNGEEYRNGNYIWVKVEPVKWLIDDETGILVSKKGLLSGIRFHAYDRKYSGDFNTTEIKEYLDNYMSKDIIPSKIKVMTPEEKQAFEKRKKELEKKRNPYGLNLNKASEEDIIRGAIESGVAVFLHGEPSEGKSARVKQIDPTCEIIYLRNASPESLNGKSVYNSSTGEMIDIKPSWLKKIEEKCEKEPDRYHIVFLDEITNALPSIQGIAFNIVLDREVNGIWKLPDNARIVAAGNEMKDSLAANQLAEPLFNRFAHVYIKTTTESWLKWASENNIHPAIYAYVAYKKGEVLRSKYDGEKPNADPRKWEMASKMLYKTGQPEMLRALIGEDITKEFVKFCNQRVITLEDVLKGNVREEESKELNTSERYATTFGLTQVSEEDVIKVREFIKKIDPEFVSMFDVLWTHNDESRLEIIAEAKLMNNKGRVLKR